MKNSASERNKKSRKSSTFFETSETGYSSEYGLYNSSGQLLKGNELFEQYSELAKQLDTKRSVFYLQLKENEIIFGCSLIVKAANGREERAVFIQVNKNLSSGYKIESNIELLKQFYEVVQYEIDTFELKKYQLVGLWSEGDFQNIKEIEIERGLKYTLGKISAGKKVSVKISELSSGLNLVLELIVKSKKNIPLVFDVSQFPSESDVSVSLIKPNPDFEIGENGNLQNFVISESWLHFEKLGETLYKKRSNAKGGQNQSAYISSIVQMITDEPKGYSDPLNPIFNNYDDGEKVEIFKGLIQNLNKKNYGDLSDVLINIYGKVEASKSKKDIQLILFFNNIYIKEIVIDLIKDIHTNHNKDFFDVLFNTDTPLDNRYIKSSDKKDEELEELQTRNSSAEWYDQYDQWKEKQERKLRKTSDGFEEQQKWRDLKTGSNYSFEKGVNDVLRDLTYSQKVEFVQFITSEARSKPEEKGAFLLNRLVRDLVSQDYKDFISELNEEELEKLDKILGSHHLTTKKEQKKRKINWFINKAVYAGAAVVIIFMAFTAYTYLMGGGEEKNASSNSIDNVSNLSAVSSGEGNSTPSIDENNKSTSNPGNSSFGEGDNNSSSNKKENVLNSSGTIPGEGSTNLSGDKSENNSNLSETDLGGGGNNSSSEK